MERERSPSGDALSGHPRRAGAENDPALTR